LFETGVCPAAFLHLPSGFPGWLFVCKSAAWVCAGVFACVYMCVCDWGCASVLRRCCFPQPWSNSVVTQSPCERFPASVLPPVDSLSPAGWVCLTEAGSVPTGPLPLLHLLPPYYPASHQDWFTVSTVVAVGSSDAHSRACILCAHHPDILYLPLNNCCSGVRILWVWWGGRRSGRHLYKWDNFLDHVLTWLIFQFFCIYTWGMTLCKVEKMPPMLVLNRPSNWGKCLPDSLRTTMLSYGPQLPVCPFSLQSAPRRYIGQGPHQAWDPFPPSDRNTPAFSFFTFLPLLASTLLVLFG